MYNWIIFLYSRTNTTLLINYTPIQNEYEKRHWNQLEKPLKIIIKQVSNPQKEKKEEDKETIETFSEYHLD